MRFRLLLLAFCFSVRSFGAEDLAKVFTICPIIIGTDKATIATANATLIKVIRGLNKCGIAANVLSVVAKPPRGGGAAAYEKLGAQVCNKDSETARYDGGNRALAMFINGPPNLVAEQCQSGRNDRSYCAQQVHDWGNWRNLMYNAATSKAQPHSVATAFVNAPLEESINGAIGLAFSGLPPGRGDGWGLGPTSQTSSQPSRLTGNERGWTDTGCADLARGASTNPLVDSGRRLYRALPAEADTLVAAPSEAADLQQLHFQMWRELSKGPPTGVANLNGGGTPPHGSGNAAGSSSTATAALEPAPSVPSARLPDPAPIFPTKGEAYSSVVPGQRDSSGVTTLREGTAVAVSATGAGEGSGHDKKYTRELASLTEELNKGARPIAAESVPTGFVGTALSGSTKLFPSASNSDGTSFVSATGSTSYDPGNPFVGQNQEPFPSAKRGKPSSSRGEPRSREKTGRPAAIPVYNTSTSVGEESSY